MLGPPPELAGVSGLEAAATTWACTGEASLAVVPCCWVWVWASASELPEELKLKSVSALPVLMLLLRLPPATAPPAPSPSSPNGPVAVAGILVLAPCTCGARGSRRSARERERLLRGFRWPGLGIMVGGCGVAFLELMGVVVLARADRLNVEL